MGRGGGGGAGPGVSPECVLGFCLSENPVLAALDGAHVLAPAWPALPGCPGRCQQGCPHWPGQQTSARLLRPASRAAARAAAALLENLELPSLDWAVALPLHQAAALQVPHGPEAVVPKEAAAQLVLVLVLDPQVLPGDAV